MVRSRSDKQFIIKIYKTIMTQNPAILKDEAVQRVADAGVGKSNVYRVISAYMTNHIIGIKSPQNKKDSVCLN